jgi:uncharacterized protein YbcI
MDIIEYYSQLNAISNNFEPVRKDIYLLIRMLGRILSPAEYVFAGEDEKEMFRSIRINFITRILK